MPQQLKQVGTKQQQQKRMITKALQEADCSEDLHMMSTDPYT